MQIFLLSPDIKPNNRCFLAVALTVYLGIQLRNATIYFDKAQWLRLHGYSESTQLPCKGKYHSTADLLFD